MQSMISSTAAAIRNSAVGRKKSLATVRTQPSSATIAEQQEPVKPEMDRKPSSASVLTLTAEKHAKATGEGKTGGVMQGNTGLEKAKQEDRIIVGIDFG